MKIRNLLNFPFFYELLQAPLKKETIKPLLKRQDIAYAKDVLDIGCGPGTYVNFFANTNYLGVDIDPSYISFAKSQYPDKSFITQDARKLNLENGRLFDFILINSILHHLDDQAVKESLSSAEHYLSGNGNIHILELVLIPEFSVSSAVTRFDRGDYPRPYDTWMKLFTDKFECIESEPYEICFCGICICKMIYFKGKKK